MTKRITLEKLTAKTKEGLEVYGEIAKDHPCQCTCTSNEEAAPFMNLPLVLMKEGEVASILALEKSALQKRRQRRNTKLPYVKAERMVYYRFCDVVRYINEHLVMPANDNDKKVD